MCFVDDKFAIELTDKCNSEAEWISVVNFGKQTLLKNPLLLMEIIVRRAHRLKLSQPAGMSKETADFACELMGRLGLRFELESH